MTKSSFKFVILFFLPFFLAAPISAQDNVVNTEEAIPDSDFIDRKAIIETIKNFYIGDHTGSIEHKKLSMHEKGAYRYINRDGKYSESIFRPDSDDSDTNYKEELLSIEIYDKMAVAKLRLDQFGSEKPEYKLMILHKAEGLWKITTITWGFGITQ